MKKLSKMSNAKQSVLLEQLYSQYEQQMYGIAYSILHQAEQAEDAVQDAFIKLIPYLPKIEGAETGKTKGLVLQVLRTTAIDQYRKNSKDADRFIFEEQAVTNKVVSFDVSQQAVDRDLISRMLFELEPNYLEIIKLRCYLGFTNREAAAELGITEEAAAKRLERARKSIQKRMGDEINESGTEFRTHIESSGKRSASKAITG